MKYNTSFIILTILINKYKNMKKYYNEQEVKKDLINWVLKIDDDVKFYFSIRMDINIIAKNITAYSIVCYNINANFIKAYDIDCYNINTDEINCYNIIADDINCYNINSDNIDAKNVDCCHINSKNIIANNINSRKIIATDIIADNIKANHIDYYAVCSAYHSLECKTIQGRKKNSKHFCLDKEIEIINQ